MQSAANVALTYRLQWGFDCLDIGEKKQCGVGNSDNVCDNHNYHQNTKRNYNSHMNVWQQTWDIHSKHFPQKIVSKDNEACFRSLDMIPNNLLPSFSMLSDGAHTQLAALHITIVSFG